MSRFRRQHLERKEDEVHVAISFMMMCYSRPCCKRGTKSDDAATE